MNKNNYITKKYGWQDLWLENTTIYLYEFYQNTFYSTKFKVQEKAHLQKFDLLWTILPNKRALIELSEADYNSSELIQGPKSSIL